MRWYHVCADKCCGVVRLAIDPYSAVQILSPERLAQLRYTRYTPAIDEASSPAPTSPPNNNLPPLGTFDGASARVLAHAVRLPSLTSFAVAYTCFQHVAMVRYSDLARFLQQGMGLIVLVFGLQD